LISAVLILAVCFIRTGISWGGSDLNPPPAAASPDAQTVLAQADATNTETPAQTTAPPAAAAPSTTATTPAPEQANVPTTEVTVTAEKPKPGSAAAGYRVENTTTTGPWGEMKLQDTPYSILVMPAELIENVQAPSVDMLFRMNPLVQLSLPQTREGSGANMNLRGFFSSATGRAEDGMQELSPLYPASLEDKESVEVLTGLSSFLYGPANVGGMVNFVNKRPTDTPLYSLTAGNYGGDSYYVHGDFGGPIYQDKIAYRFNVLTQDGNTNVDHQNLQRDLFSGALDFHLLDNLLLQFNGSHDEDRMQGGQAAWFFSTNALGTATAFHPSAPDASKNWGQEWTQTDQITEKAETRLTWNLSDVFTFRSAYRYSIDDVYTSVFANNWVTSNNGTYYQTQYEGGETYETAKAGYALLDAKFSTGFVENKVTGGYTGGRLVTEAGNGAEKFTNIYDLNFIEPTYVANPGYYRITTGALSKLSMAENENWLIGDEAKFSDSWSALIGGNYTEIITKNFNTTTGLLTSQYDQGKPTPSASLLYKPISWITTYATYMEGLEQGAIVPATGSIKYTNGGEALPPFTDYQYEVGAKATLGGALLTAAVFDIDRALQYAVNNGNGTETYVQSGRQDNKGFEFTVTGKATTNLTLWGGLTLLDAKVTKNQANPQWDGKVPTNVAQQMVKLYGEYAINAIPGFVLTGGVYYTGKQYADSMNTDTLPAVFTEDIGARYTMTLKTYPLILRLNVTNLTNKSYWSDSNYLGDPLRIMFSAQVKF
jgi:iron complex outermembrane receptor protein